MCPTARLYTGEPLYHRLLRFGRWGALYASRTVCPWLDPSLDGKGLLTIIAKNVECCLRMMTDIEDDGTVVWLDDYDDWKWVSRSMEGIPTATESQSPLERLGLTEDEAWEALRPLERLETGPAFVDAEGNPKPALDRTVVTFDIKEIRPALMARLKKRGAAPAGN